MAEHAFSVIFTAEAIAMPLHTTPGEVTAWLVYLAADALPPSRRDMPPVQIHGRPYVRMSVLPYDTWAHCVSRVRSLEPLPGLGKLCRIRAAEITRWLPTRGPELIRDNIEVFETLEAALGVSRHSLGLTGSSLYKPVAERADIDFVVYGEQASRAAAGRLAELLPAAGDAYLKDGTVQHWRFRISGSPHWFDPRFAAVEPLTAALVSGTFRDCGAMSVAGLQVIEDRDGIFYPSRYLLSDGSTLFSYRMGHNGYFTAGDTLGDTSLPTVEVGGHRYRVVLRQESIDRLPARRTQSANPSSR